MFKYPMDRLPLIILISIILILYVDASAGPKLKVNFGLNLPALSFKLPSMSLPKMKITAVIAQSRPKRPMKIQLPAISLHAKSLEDSWGGEGGGYEQGYANQGGGNGGYGNIGGAGGGNGGGWSNNGGGGNNIDEGKPYETAYASSNEEEFVDPHDEDNYEENEEEQGESNQQYGQDQPTIGPNQPVNYTTAQPIDQPQTSGMVTANDYKSNNGFYQMKPVSRFNQQFADEKNQEKSTNHEQVNQPIYPSTNPVIINKQENTNQLNYGPPRSNQYALASPLPSNENRNTGNPMDGGYNVNHGYRQFIVKLPHNFQLPQLQLNDNRYNGQQFNGNDNDNYIHQSPYFKRFIVSNEQMQLTPNTVILTNNQNSGYKTQLQTTNQPDFSKRSMFNPNYYRYAIVA